MILVAELETVVVVASWLQDKKKEPHNLVLCYNNMYEGFTESVNII